MSFSGCVADDLGGRRRAVGERELDRGRAVDDVQAGQDVAVEVDDDAAAEAVVVVGVGASSGSATPSVWISTSDGWTAW